MRGQSFLNSLILFTILFCGIICNAEKIPALSAPELAKAPVINGKLDDECWKKTDKSTCFHIHKAKDKATTKNTVVMLGRDDKFLYIAFQCLNPNMRFLDQHGVSYDDPGVFKDDSVEIFLTREGMNRYYHYVFNYANVKADRRIMLKGGRDLSWSYPWISATKQGEKGWTAEVAIPLELLNTQEPGDVRINFLRNKINVSLDMMGAKKSESRQYQFWSPVKRTAHEPESFGIISGLKNRNMAPAALLVQVDGLKTGELAADGNKFNFDVSANLLGVSPVAGNVDIDVVEMLDNGTEIIIAKKSVSLPPRSLKKISINVPVEDFSPKKLSFRVKNRASGMVLDAKPLPFEGVLLKELYPEFSYYSGEKTLRVKALLDMSAKALQPMTLTMTDKSGKTVAECKSPSREVVLSADAAVLKDGSNIFTVKLVRNDGKIFGEKQLEITRLRKKANESKIDHFKRIVLFKGKPYFPFGMYSGGGFSGKPVVKNAYIKNLKSAKMNTLIMSIRFYKDFDEAALKEKLNAMAETGINIIIWGGLQHIQYGMSKIKSMEEKKKLIRKKYEKVLKTNIIPSIEIIKNRPNMLAWYGVDEPNLCDWKAKIFVEKLFWKTIKKLDPYHVVLGLYARSIPRVPEATECFDLLGYDIYTYPDWKHQHSKICDPMAAQTAQLDKRAAENRQPIWIIPQPANFNPARCPRPLSGQEQLCQSYTAMIYGAKGLIYFNFMLACNEESWKALRMLGEQVAVISPALLNFPVKQSIKYASASYDVARWQIPPVPFKLFRFPDGKLIALAVNSKNYPVDLSVKIKNLAGVKRMFSDKSEVYVRSSRFRDKLEPYGVRAYGFKLANDSAKEINVSIATTLHPKEAKSITCNEALMTAARSKKNLVLNPSFEMGKVPGIPDFYMPWKIVRVTKINGEGPDYVLDSVNPKFGKVSLRLTRPAGYNWAGVFGITAIPKDSSKDYTFSFYTRASQENSRLWVGFLKKGKWKSQSFNISTEWKRYSMKCDSPGEEFFIQIIERKDLSKACTIWLDGLQLEQGKKPTEFTEK